MQTLMKHPGTAILFFFLLSLTTDIFAQKTDRVEIAGALQKAVEFHRAHLATEGGYLWKYSADLLKREGEGIADDKTVWVQPPGTPAIGSTLLRTYRITGDRYYLEAATDAGLCLGRGQLESGGWTYMIHFDPEQRAKYRYRVDGRKNGRNVSTLDDNTTQAALLFLMELDKALDFKNETIGESVRYGLEKLVEAQYPNGAFPQGFQGDKRNPSDYPILKASFPPEGAEPTREKDYWRFYTLNDNLARDVNRVFFAAADIYGTKNRNPKYVEAAEKLGDFLIAARLPDPQPAWAQQYDFGMRPCWARKFEPAAVTGGESQSVIDTLIELYRFSGKTKYLEPIPHAVEYLEKSRRPDGTVARFYEMRTNKPLYMTKQYELTYSDADVPTHYAFTVRLRSWPSVDEIKKTPDKPARSKVKDRGIARILASLDHRGAWITEGTLRSSPNKTSPIIDNAVFLKNVNTLLDALEE